MVKLAVGAIVTGKFQGKSFNGEIVQFEATRTLGQFRIGIERNHGKEIRFVVNEDGTAVTGQASPGDFVQARN